MRQFQDVCGAQVPRDGGGGTDTLLAGDEDDLLTSIEARRVLTSVAAGQAKAALPMIRSMNSATLKCLFSARKGKREHCPVAS